ncbi:enoyl-CoA hydratase/isomerase family protein [Halobacterium sp. R2-5]|uniref:enoyl-CoA hydratase/isomerase family protein n=1 Tax=Halobacterium sp. R2-5 TaxID=2715751 RepID=UPI001422EE39|nr:enoyl-CoA hydratase/isomerase family protein [Halobacterium sp. R2-5]NIB99778.1 enoyl-CoA hydratase/isomerase family protein [Halobacterium sp. R2-5]
MLRVTDGDAVRVATLDRPTVRNALTPDALDDLRDAVTDADQPVVYVHGAGDAFCAGADLDVVRGLDGPRGEAFARRGQRTMNAIEDSDSVVVAGVDGAARGGGVELALACDVRVCTPDATFAEPGVSLGVFGAWGGTRRLSEAVGATHAADLSLSGRTIDAETARDVGLVSRVAADPREVAEEIAANDPAALRELTGLLSMDASREESDRAEADAFARLLADDPFEN